VSAPVPSHSSYRASQAIKDKKENKEYIKQMSEMAQIVQQKHLENKKLEKLFSDAKRQALQLSEALSQQQENPPADPWKKLSHQRSLGLITRSPEEEDFFTFLGYMLT
jgi:hypothetical protein